MHITLTNTPPLPRTTPTPTPNLILSTYQNWKTYTNDEIGIQFKYPDGWEITLPSSDKQSWHVVEVASFKPSSHNDVQYAVGLFYYENPENLSLEELAKKLTGNSGIIYNLYSSRTHVKMTNRITAYYYDRYFCETSICQAYSWSYKVKPFFLQTTPNQYPIKN